MPPAKTLVSGREGTECLFCISVEARADVDRLVEAGVKEGGRPDPTVLPEMGGGFARSVEDPDGHVWEVAFMGEMGKKLGE
ncbi:hypothetical protein K505DRAFT_232262 [Melanomma pulvis-pyrius CBS 109.77]|uniref:Glyoxalase/fosfomycin resistance/dioxygenase domain-containing protein n=1 Tax=Melanomma pulvis-pyrius CBS 109.77 TaxID=1314802 RepID=A0A6A6XSB9_9PLEO|nr:hypothetical protein K505DRAFT_232262 [Melanomma pulvis-pyrius CBS 109.77]